MQDLQKLTDKLNLLEDLIQNEEDSTSLQGLLQNPTIGQMYRNCRSELPKLLELTDSDGLNEDLMNKIINITERLMEIKATVEKPEKELLVVAKANEIELFQSSDQLNSSFTSVFNDLPLLSPNPNKLESKQTISVNQKSFLYSRDLLIDSFQISNPDQFMTRIMNISSKQVRNVKLDGKMVKNKLDPFETFITTKRDLKSVEYNEDEVIEIDEMSGNVNGIENLLLI